MPHGPNSGGDGRGTGRATPSLRTCIGCRQVEERWRLARLYIRESKVMVAGTAMRPAEPRSGRGAWIHPDAKCVAAAVRTRAFSRAFRRAVDPPEVNEILAALAHASTP